MTLKEHIEAQVAEVETRDPERLRGSDWYQLSDEEEFVFGIDRERFPRMLVALKLYRCLSGQVSATALGFDPGLIEAERRAWSMTGRQPTSEEQFTKIATELVGLTQRESHALWAKDDFSDHRQGIIVYRDER
jgi:hypothetical protein